MITQHIILIILSFLVFSISEKNKFKLTCVDKGECMKCSSYEIKEDYCKKTGKKLQIFCKGYDTELDDFRSCNVTASDDQFRVLVFQVIMAIIGGLAYWGVQSRKPQHMSKFDYRKQRRVKDEGKSNLSNNIAV
mmetsp:Transcript_5487/g.4940  ORF Transcript_5487/g.4940 Transcript_5487/m.4940 type:complete len:134 (+) Transcript_5487:87-488(+)